ncbi:Serine phosphatase RsbU, regulator of sigma subunit [Catalinimonas alkaloidigena]|uniref:Serine phosphatase RsbU, regulator of sigma subunit n=1 Tax=Catalinimonas alkaloidigena TaxID=1075417 RepID=A0A1G9GHA4_9BACT|nr:SpoIIE family protein phosphatase [Catalinimonas alkaloidigena]SDK99895.1 Serine phosphatase RsbU, regulator of sigma subunit [Catalinimonas alkaloidigena]
MHLLRKTLRTWVRIFAFLLVIPALSAPASLEEFEQLLTRALQDKNHQKASLYCYELAKLHEAAGRTTEAVDYLEQSLKWGGKADDLTLLYLSNQRMGTLLSKEGNHNKAVSYYQKALKSAQELKKTTWIKQSLVDVGLGYVAMGRAKRALEPFEEALSLAIREGDAALQEKCYAWLADAYTREGDATKAAKYQALYEGLASNEAHLKTLQAQAKQAGQERIAATQQLRQTETTLLATQTSLQETALSLREAEALSENQRLEIDLLSKEKELAALQILEQDVRLQKAALFRNAILIVALMASALIGVMVYSYRKQVTANKEIARQHDDIARQHKDIQGSINYAQRIQEAMLHHSNVRREQLPDSFVLFKPRDSVSGDFYWIAEVRRDTHADVAFAAVDCTGHGVPGAFMSMIGINTLNGIVGRQVHEPHHILDHLDTEIRTALQQETTGNKDGMDAALCVYRSAEGVVEFAGAKNPLVYIQNGELYQIKGDVNPIGGSLERRKAGGYKKHIIRIDQPTTLYLFSDGFQDQFGGPDNGKFMTKRFKQLLLDIHQQPMEKQQEVLHATIEAWKNGGKQTDDILVMGFRLGAPA